PHQTPATISTNPERASPTTSATHRSLDYGTANLDGLAFIERRPAQRRLLGATVLRRRNSNPVEPDGRDLFSGKYYLLRQQSSPARQAFLCRSRGVQRSYALQRFRL